MFNQSPPPPPPPPLLLLLLLLTVITVIIIVMTYVYMYTVYSLKERDHLEDLDTGDGRTRIEQNLRSSVGIDLVHDTDSWRAP